MSGLSRTVLGSKATQSVGKALHRESGMWTKVGEGFPRGSVEEFSAAAKRYLSDRSNLSSRTLEAADWTTLYEEFRDN